ncbi:nucleoporin protein Ndc1-Nup [Ephemerocybe angulata]|uniref:Nucleoporin protein Ndc1-Nup n=1 Tax=Ephemerocybe angulata TaxID=980116 RepID=A0A8H6H8X9_9AGAR|nr:nucleoporin protein Ndc1-Nup [Tulosesus angulatus]
MSTSTPSGSRFRTSTPVKAKTSTLINRSSPSLPPASQTFEPQVKSVLRYRLSRVFLWSALLCWVVNTVWVVWQTGGPGHAGLWGIVTAPLGFLTLVGSLVLWISSAVPVIVLRKVFLTPQRTAATSPQKSLAAALSKSSTKTAFVTYALSAVALAFIHTVQSGDPRLSLFVKSKKHPQYLNGRFLFLILSQLVTAASFLLRNLLRDRFAFRWIGMSSGKPVLLLDLFLAFMVSAVSITAALPLACTLFGLVRMLVLPILYKLPFLPLFLRPFTAHFLRGPYTLSLPFRHLAFLGRAWFVGFTTLFLWEAAETMFDDMLAEPVDVGAPSPVPLVSGIASTDPIMKYFAYAELSKMTASSVAHRQTLFGDQNNIPNVWGTFVRESLLLLGKDYQRLLRRGAEPVASTGPASTPSKPSGPPAIGTPVPLLRQSILRSQAGSPREEVLNTLASDGPLAKVVDQTAEAAHIPELFRSVASTPLKETAVVEAAKAAATTVAHPAGLVQRVKSALRKRVGDLYEQHAPEFVKEQVVGFVKWWTEDRISKKVDMCLPMRELDVVVIEVLTKMVCASLTEDRYGNVQRDIPKILEALLAFLSAVEDYQSELLKQMESLPDDPSIREPLREELEKATGILAYVGDGLKNGVARIVLTFGDTLTAFKFPPRTAAKLQGFMDFRQAVAQ